MRKGVHSGWLLDARASALRIIGKNRPHLYNCFVYLKLYAREALSLPESTETFPLFTLEGFCCQNFPF